MRQPVFAFLLALLSACSAAPHVVAGNPGPLSRRASVTEYRDACLSVDIVETGKLGTVARRLRQGLGFWDMGRAVPPRPADEFHITVAYFPTLATADAQRLREHWAGQKLTLQVDGWGMAQHQVA